MRIFEPKMDAMLGGWGRLSNLEFQNLYFSPSIIRVTKSRRIGWAGYVTHMKEKRN
jgi:hypothetical protein